MEQQDGGLPTALLAHLRDGDVKPLAYALRHGLKELALAFERVILSKLERYPAHHDVHRLLAFTAPPRVSGHQTAHPLAAVCYTDISLNTEVQHAPEQRRWKT